MKLHVPGWFRPVPSQQSDPWTSCVLAKGLASYACSLRWGDITGLVSQKKTLARSHDAECVPALFLFFLCFFLVPYFFLFVYWNCKHETRGNRLESPRQRVVVECPLRLSGAAQWQQQEDSALTGIRSRKCSSSGSGGEGCCTGAPLRFVVGGEVWRGGCCRRPLIMPAHLQPELARRGRWILVRCFLYTWFPSGLFAKFVISKSKGVGKRATQAGIRTQGGAGLGKRAGLRSRGLAPEIGRGARPGRGAQPPFPTNLGVGDGRCWAQQGMCETRGGGVGSERERGVSV